MITFMLVALLTFNIANSQDNSSKIAENFTYDVLNVAKANSGENVTATLTNLATTAEKIIEYASSAKLREDIKFKPTSTAVPSKNHSIDENKCVIIPQSQLNGAVNCTNKNNIGSICRYECKHGFELKGPPSIRCTETEKKWSNSIPRCEPIACPILQSPTNGMIRCSNGNRWRSTCIFKCNKGFILSSIENNCFSCLANKSWKSASPSTAESEIPSCLSAGCYPKQSSPVNGYVSCTDKNYVGSNCSFECIPGYEIIGSSSIICADTRNQIYAWSSSSPICGDINECQRQICETNERCVNNRGSYQCFCKAGYQKQNGICSDINECQRQICGTNERCVNNPGSYQCLCIAGYQKRDGICSDINECQRQICGTNERCVNSPGSFQCVSRTENQTQNEACGDSSRFRRSVGCPHWLCRISCVQGQFVYVQPTKCSSLLRLPNPRSSKARDLFRMCYNCRTRHCNRGGIIGK